MGRHNTPVHLLERFRQEQRASRAARRAGQQPEPPVPVHAPPTPPEPVWTAKASESVPDPVPLPDPVPPAAPAGAPPAPVQPPARFAEPGQPAATLPVAGHSSRLAGLVLACDRRHPRPATGAGSTGATAVATPNGTGDAAFDRPATATFDGAAGGAGGAPGEVVRPAVDDAGTAGNGERVAVPARAGGLTQREPTIERIRTGIRGLGQALITFGVVILLFVAYELWITDLFNRHTQGQLANQLSDTWNRGEDPLSPTVGEPGVKVRDLPIGRGIALIRIPAFGLDYVKVVVEGTEEPSLAEGPGHYVGTALPGQVGNMAIAGHRVGKGSPFLDLDRLRAGDAIVIETKTTYYVYRVLGDRRTGNPAIPDSRGIPGRQIVAPTDTDVIRPVPDRPGLAPIGRFLTLTTCHPRFSARQRLIIHAELAGRPWPKSNGLPPVLRG